MINIVPHFVLDTVTDLEGMQSLFGRTSTFHMALYFSHSLWVMVCAFPMSPQPKNEVQIPDQKHREVRANVT